MKSKAEQIEAIVSMDTFRWAMRQLAHPDDINEKKFPDFISVTERELVNHLIASGFDQGALASGDSEEKICVMEHPNTWTVYYFERGRRHDVTRHDSRASAATEVAKRLIKSAKISLNHRFRNAHPEQNLPHPSEM